MSSSFSLKEIFKYKSLLVNLARRDFLVRYKQAFAGILWALIKPLISIIIFGYIGSKISLGHITAVGFLNVTIGLLLWQLFSSVFGQVSSSIVENSNLFSKVYFPKIVIPISTILVCLIDFLISCFILVVICFIAQQQIYWHIVFIPFIILLTIINGFGLGLIFATLFVKYREIINGFGLGLIFATLFVKYRDVRYVVPVILQFGMYATPVIFSSAFYLIRLPVWLHWLYCLNPMVAVIDGFKFCLFGESIVYSIWYFIFSIAISFLLLFLGIKFFYKFERNFVDII